MIKTPLMGLKGKRLSRMLIRSIRQKLEGSYTTVDATPPSEEDGDGALASTFDDQMPTGIAFIDSAIKPMTYELEDRFWAWRPNDLVRITDNVNHFQLGVLEVTRHGRDVGPAYFPYWNHPSL